MDKDDLKNNPVYPVAAIFSALVRQRGQWRIECGKAVCNSADDVNKAADEYRIGLKNNGCLVRDFVIVQVYKWEMDMAGGNGS